MSSTQVDDKQALQDLIFDKDLERLEALIAEFNIFEAIGAVRQERRHSDFLSFILDPNQNHGLSDIVLKRVLMHILANAPDLPLTAIDIDLMHIDQAEVMREWHNIDIFIHDLHNNLAVIIENKIDADEHSNQLARYLNVVQAEFPKAIIISIFLTPDGDTPSNDAYIPVSYDTIAVVIEGVCQSYESTIGHEVLTLLNHYTTMLRRHIVTDSEVAELSRKIYRRHQRALDLIFENLPDLLTDIADYLTSLIDRTDGLVKDHCSKTYIRFCPEEWDLIPALLLGQGWTRSKRLLLFEFQNFETKLSLKVTIGPGDQTTRDRLFAMCDSDENLFKGRTAQLTPKWTRIYERIFLSRSDLEGGNLEDLTTKIDEAWNRFLADDFPAITGFVARAEFPEPGY